MHHTLNTLRQGAIVLALLAATGFSLAKSVPGDAAIPVVELMPLTMRYEVEPRRWRDRSTIGASSSKIAILPTLIGQPMRRSEVS